MTATTYASKDELKRRVALNTSVTASDDLLQQILNSSAELVDAATRGFREGYEAFSASASLTRYFDDRVYDYGFLELDDEEIANDALTITAITIAGTAVSVSDYKLWPYNRGNGPATRIYFSDNVAELVVVPAFRGGAYSNWGGSGAIAVTGIWGYCTAANRPAAIKEATLLQAEKTYESIGLTPEALVAGFRNPYKSLDPLADTYVTKFKRKRKVAVTLV